MAYFRAATEQKAVFKNDKVVMYKFNVLQNDTTVGLHSSDYRPAQWESGVWYEDYRNIAAAGGKLRQFQEFANSNKQTPSTAFVAEINKVIKYHKWSLSAMPPCNT